MVKVNPDLQGQIKTLVESMGYEFVGCEMQSQGRQTLFRIYADKIGGITAGDCSRISHQMSAMMDVEDPVPGRYILEVSSPGIDRPLFELDHYRRFIGERVKVKLVVPVGQRRQYTGLLKSVEGEAVHLLVDGSEQEVELPFSNIEKGNLIGEVHL